MLTLGHSTDWVLQFNRSDEMLAEVMGSPEEALDRAEALFIRENSALIELPPQWQTTGRRGDSASFAKAVVDLVENVPRLNAPGIFCKRIKNGPNMASASVARAR